MALASAEILVSINKDANSEVLWLNESVHLNGISYPTKRGVYEQKEAELFSRV